MGWREVQMWLLQLLFDSNLCPLCSGCRELRFKRFLQWREQYSEIKMSNITKLVLLDALKGASGKNGCSNTRRRGGAVQRTAVYDHEEERSPCLSTTTVSGSIPLTQGRMFTEINQNKNPFVLTFFLDDKEYKKKKKVADEKARQMQCGMCHNEFLSTSIPPQDWDSQH